MPGLNSGRFVGRQVGGYEGTMQRDQAAAQHTMTREQRQQYQLERAAKCFGVKLPMSGASRAEHSEGIAKSLVSICEKRSTRAPGLKVERKKKKLYKPH